MSEMRSLEEALTATYDNLDRLSPRDISAFWAVVPKFLRGRGRYRTTNQQQQQEQMFHQFDLILTKSIQDIDHYGYRELATLAISLAKIIDKMSKRKGHPAEGSSHQVLQDLIGENKQFIFKEIASASVPVLYEFDARHIANLIYAFGLVDEVVLVNDGSTFFDMLAEEVLSFDSLDEFWPQHFSNIIWAYATANEKHPKLFKKIGDHIVTMNNLNEFWPQALSNTLWAYATLNEQHAKLFKKVGDHIVHLPNLESFNGQDLSNTVWAYATAGESNPQLFKKVADHIVTLPSLRMFNGQDCSNTLWAIATAGESHPHLFERLADHIIELPNLNGFKSQALSNTVWAYSTAGESNLQLFNKLADEAIKRQHEFIPQHISNFLWAHATNGKVDKHLFSSLVPSVKANLHEYSAQGLTNIAWAYSVANVDAPSVFNNEFIDACLKKECEFILDALRQLHQWQLWQDEIKSGVSLPPSLKKKCSEAFISQEFSPSKFQDDVVSILSSMDLNLQEEVLLKSGYRIDAVVEVNGKQIAVEVDGPFHFIGRERTGSTILKHRQVAALDGMPVVSVPYWEWDKLKKDNKKKPYWEWDKLKKDNKKKEKYLHSLLGL